MLARRILCEKEAVLLASRTPRRLLKKLLQNALSWFGKNAFISGFGPQQFGWAGRLTASGARIANGGRSPRAQPKVLRFEPARPEGHRQSKSGGRPFLQSAGIHWPLTNQLPSDHTREIPNSCSRFARQQKEGELPHILDPAQASRAGTTSTAPVASQSNTSVPLIFRIQPLGDWLHKQSNAILRWRSFAYKCCN